VIVEIQKWYEELEQQIGQAARLEGKLEGEIEARIATMTSIFTKRLGRRLSDAEQVVLSERLEHLGEDRLVDLCFTRDGDALAAWLADPGAR
jgi:predicted methyltransferase MtxX (methanogen marker protein 4)